MNYEEKYENLLKRVRDVYKSTASTGNVWMLNALRETFPELKESEDERIREWLLGELHLAYHRAAGDREREDCLKEAIAWLEKQGVHKPTDNVEPKFHEGDWVADKLGNTLYVKKVYDSFSKVIDKQYRIYNYDNQPMNENCHLWTIQDAKEGDVLCCENGRTCIFKALDNHTNTFSSYCFMDSDKWFCNTGGECHTLDKAFVKAYNGEIHPATKEQRDLLFRKMKEAGYEWDDEKKELKKIEQNAIEFNDLIEESYQQQANDLIDMVTEKSTWSEKDEDYINDLIKYFSQNEKLENTEEDIVIWLKSLRPQSYWKPTEKQLHWLKLTIEELTDISTENGKTAHSVLSELLEQLNKL